MDYSVLKNQLQDKLIPQFITNLKSVDQLSELQVLAKELINEVAVLLFPFHEIEFKGIDSVYKASGVYAVE